MTTKDSTFAGGNTTSNEIMRAIAAASLDALITADAVGDIIEFSPSAEKLFGYTRSEVLGRSVAEIVIPPHLRDAHTAGMAHYNATGEGPVINTRVEVPAIRRDGEEFAAELTVIPLMIDEQRFFTAFIRDISEEKARQAELQTARKVAEYANHAKTRFLATMSHELRTPLHSILGANDLLQDADLGEREQGIARIIQQSGEALLGLISQILDFSNMDTAGIALAPEPVNLRPLLENTLARVRPLAQDKGLDLTLEVPEDLPAWVEVDGPRLQNVLSNLLDNAQKFTAEGQIGLTVEIVERTAANLSLRFTVHDSGVGIAPEVQGRLFEDFAQVDDTDSTAYAGMGLGLTICQHVVRAMGGQIDVRSTPGQGSAFAFTVQMPLAEEPPQVPRHVAVDPPRVLVVEDGPTNQIIVRAMLERAGYQVDIAANGLAAVEAVEAQRYRAVLMDLRMPIVDGLEATRQIRERRYRHGQVPIIALTANVTDADRRRCFEAGMNDFLAKPINRDKLLERLGVWCAKSQSRVEQDR